MSWASPLLIHTCTTGAVYCNEARKSQLQKPEKTSRKQNLADIQTLFILFGFYIPYLFISSLKPLNHSWESANATGQAINDQCFLWWSQKWQISFWVRYDSIFNETAGGCKTWKMILKIIASCGNQLKFDSVLFCFSFSFSFFLWRDVTFYIKACNMCHASGMALMCHMNGMIWIIWEILQLWHI